MPMRVCIISDFWYFREHCLGREVSLHRAEWKLSLQIAMQMPGEETGAAGLSNILWAVGNIPTIWKKFFRKLIKCSSKAKCNILLFYITGWGKMPPFPFKLFKIYRLGFAKYKSSKFSLKSEQSKCLAITSSQPALVPTQLASSTVSTPHYSLTSVLLLSALS